MAKIELTRLTPEMIEAAYKNDCLGDGLKSLFDVLDPKNENDLGGHAGVFFSDIDESDWEHEMSWETRWEHIKSFLDHLGKFRD